jgi:hypothetical protein
MNINMKPAAIVLVTPLIAVAFVLVIAVLPSAQSAAQGLEGSGAGILALLVYFVPALFAASRKHHNKGAIFATNLLLGWTLLGWIIAFIWASTNPAPVRK